MSQQDGKKPRLLPFVESAYDFAKALGASVPFVDSAVRIAKAGSKFASSTASLFVEDDLLARYPNLDPADSAGMAIIKADILSSAVSRVPVHAPNLRLRSAGQTSASMHKWLESKFAPHPHRKLAASLWKIDYDAENVLSTILAVFYDTKFLYRSGEIWYEMDYRSPKNFSYLKGFFKQKIMIDGKEVNCEGLDAQNVQHILDILIKMEKNYFIFVENSLLSGKRAWLKSFEKLYVIN